MELEKMTKAELIAHIGETTNRDAEKTISELTAQVGTLTAAAEQHNTEVEEYKTLIRDQAATLKAYQAGKKTGNKHPLVKIGGSFIQLPPSARIGDKVMTSEMLEANPDVVAKEVAKGNPSFVKQNA